MGATRAAALVLGLGLVTLAACGDQTEEPAAEETPSESTAAQALQSASEGCAPQIDRANRAAENAGHGPALALSEDGGTFTIVTGDGSADGASPAFRAMKCVLGELGTSASLVEQVDMSFGTEETHTATEAGLAYEWQFEYDSGYTMTIQAG